MWLKCCSVLTLENSTRPAANMPENTIPITESSFTRQCSLMYPVATAQNKPETKAPITKGIPAKKASTTPGSTAWEMASPISDQPFNTRKQEKMAHTMLVAMAVNRARCIKTKPIGSISRSNHEVIRHSPYAATSPGYESD